MNYAEFLDRKTHVGADHGFEPTFMPDLLFPFQVALTEWALRKGRSLIAAGCGLGKTPMQLTWAENVARHTGKPVLVLTPLAVAFQTVKEAEKFGIECAHRREGRNPGDSIVVTNYERMHYFDASDYAGVVCDEAQILKAFDGATRKAITDFMRRTPYRLLCTATPAPNDYIELGTSSEALGVMDRKHMLAQFFTHDGGDTSKWRLKGHARSRQFWHWMCSWARAVRKPSDIGFDDGPFILPPLHIRQHRVSAATPRDGYLFDVPAVGLDEQRADLRHTLTERCDMAASLVNATTRPALAWCNLNKESTTLARMIPDAEEVTGSDSEDRKERVFMDFIEGNVRVVVTKGGIAGLGMNFQHCAHETYFPSHSFETYFQVIRRCWRFGQKLPVNFDMIITDGQENVIRNIERKERQADAMFDQIVAAMGREIVMRPKAVFTKEMEVPSWA